MVQADAYSLRESLGNVLEAPASAIVSSLPLLTKPDAQRSALLDDAFAVMEPCGSFVQFTYGMNSPVPWSEAFEADVSAPVWLNLPPARVWVYRRKGAALMRAFDMAPRGNGRLGLRVSESGPFRPARLPPRPERRFFSKPRNVFVNLLRD